jgi:uncharacterized membrane protein
MSVKKSLLRVGLAVIVSSFLFLNFGCAGDTTGGASKAAIDIKPPSGKKSTVIAISGTGFQPQEEVDIVITLGPGKKVGLGTEKVEVIVADDKGNFSVPSAIPMNAKAGEYPIDVEGSKGSVVNTKIVVTE